MEDTALPEAPSTWYHLSLKPWKKLYVDKVKIPIKSRSHGEIRPPGMSVAPTVCQCLTAIPERYGADKQLQIYRVLVTAPSALGPESNIWDLETTQEHVITQEVLDVNGGKIVVEHAGWVMHDSNVVTAIKFAFKKLGKPLKPGDEPALWEIVEGEWKPRFTGGFDLARRLMTP